VGPWPVTRKGGDSTCPRPSRNHKDLISNYMEALECPLVVMGDVTVQRERGIKRRSRVSPYNIGSYAQPIGLQVFVADPTLQIGIKRSSPVANNRFRRRQPEEIPIIQLHLRDEEVVVGRQLERVRERDLEPHFDTADWAFAMCSYVGRPCMDSVQDRVSG